MRYAIVDADGVVINIAEWDGVAEWSPPEGMTAVPDEAGEVSPGWTYSDGAFRAPPPPPASKPAEEDEMKGGQP